MRAVIQRVNEASVMLVSEGVAGETVGRIGPGFLVLVGVSVGDTPEDARALADKVAHLRVLEDGEGRLNLSLLDRGQAALVVSNFTLYGDCRKGRRPGFSEAASGDTAESLYRAFGAHLESLGVPVQYGRFGAEMRVALVNDGPVTLLLDSKKGF